MTIPTGDYLIINGRYHNVAFLPDTNKGTTVLAVDERGNSGEKVRRLSFCFVICSSAY